MFSYDVEGILQQLDQGEGVPAASADEFAVPDGLTMVFHRGSPPLVVSDATAWLLAVLQDGPTSMAEIAALVQERFGGNGAATEKLWDQCLDTLQAMYWEGVVELT